MNMEGEKACFALPRQPGHMDGHQDGAALLIKPDRAGQVRRLRAAPYTRHGIRAGWTNVHHTTSPPVYAAVSRFVKKATRLRRTEVKRTVPQLLAPLPQEQRQQLSVKSAPVGLVAHGKVHPGLFIHDALGVGKGVKARFPVIGAHAAFSDTAEAHFTGGKVDDGIICPPVQFFVFISISGTA